jgi:hypothetical protein
MIKTQTEWQSVEMIYQASGSWNQAGVVIFIAENKIDGKPKLVRCDKEGYCILIRIAHQENIIIINICN